MKTQKWRNRPEKTGYARRRRVLGEKRENARRCQRAPGGYEHDGKDIYSREPGLQGGRDISATGEETREREDVCNVQYLNNRCFSKKERKRDDGWMRHPCGK